MRRVGGGGTREDFSEFLGSIKFDEVKKKGREVKLTKQQGRRPRGWGKSDVLVDGGDRGAARDRTGVCRGGGFALKSWGAFAYTHADMPNALNRKANLENNELHFNALFSPQECCFIVC